MVNATQVPTYRERCLLRNQDKHHLVTAQIESCSCPLTLCDRMMPVEPCLIGDW